MSIHNSIMDDFDDALMNMLAEQLNVSRESLDMYVKNNKGEIPKNIDKLEIKRIDRNYKIKKITKRNENI